MDKRAIGARALRVRGWTIVGEPPPPDPVVVMIGAPHTSNWDLFLMLWLSWSYGVEPRFLMKKEAFKGPAGPLMRSLGGISVDRSNPAGIVDDLIAHAGTAERFQIVIAPEGTRARKEYWKSGFYRIAEKAQVPIVLGWNDGASMQIGYGPSFVPTGDIRADMDRIREFYADKGGVNPENKTIPRLREEDEPQP
jgi:1-acyl-sn-glycerol-3-phosphate acyltransferase